MIITPAFMDRIVSFVHKTGNQYEFLMQGNTMYLKRTIHGSYLESGTEKNMLTNLVGFAQFYTDMREVLQFTYDMNLMYLSKTDVNNTIENTSTTLPITPIIFNK
jgi:DNA replication protein DnaD